MAEAEALSFAFMRAHPAEAARVLEAVAAGDAAALLGRAPARLAQDVVAAMLPSAAARSLGPLEDERVMALLGGLRRQPAVAILRHVPEPRRSTLIGGLPTAVALASRLLLGFPEDSVGAWCDPDVIALAGDTHAEEALERVRAADAGADPVYVTDAAQRLAGALPLARLVRAPAGTRLAALAGEGLVTLSASTPLAGALAHRGWERASILPVVDPRGHLVGALARDALARAVRRRGRPARPEQGGSVAGMLASAYWGALSGGVAALTLLLPPLRAPEGDERNGR